MPLEKLDDDKRSVKGGPATKLARARARGGTTDDEISQNRKISARDGSGGLRLFFFFFQFSFFLKGHIHGYEEYGLRFLWLVRSRRGVFGGFHHAYTYAVK